MNFLVPSDAAPDARTALQMMLRGATWLHGAVAFATRGGVDILAELFETSDKPETVKLVVRGAPITEPQALLALDRELGVEVRVVMGAAAARFHPKLWLARTPRETWVLSGSGNLTPGGLSTNIEQFELLRLEQRGAAVGQAPGSNQSAVEHFSRWGRFYELGIPLRQAVVSPAWAEWQAQLARREELRDQLRSLDNALEAAASPTGEAGIEPTPSDAELALSATTERSTIDRWMKRWFPDTTVREEVWTALADAMDAAHAHRESAWVACAVHASRHDGRPRLEVLCGYAQVFVVHSERGIFFEAPPAHVDPDSHAAVLRAASVDGATVDEWGDGDYRHPSAIVPANQLAEARAKGGLQAVEGAIEWRAPNAPEGMAAHAQFHCPALVDAARRATGRRLSQPGYCVSA